MQFSFLLLFLQFRSTSKIIGMFTGVIKLAQIDDYISPSQNCIQPKIMKPDKNESEKATVSLNDCLACSGCITSAQSILVQQMSINKFIEFVQSEKDINSQFTKQTDKTSAEQQKSKCCNQKTQQQIDQTHKHTCNCSSSNKTQRQQHNQISLICMIISPQSLLSLSKKFNVSANKFMVLLQKFLKQMFPNVQFLFFDLSIAIQLCHNLIFDQFMRHFKTGSNKPILCSQCPGWVCYAQKTLTNQITELMSQIKSPQQVLGRILRETYGKQCKIVSIMPCYDKKLQAIRFQVQQKIKQVDLTLASIEIVDLVEKFSEKQKYQFVDEQKLIEQKQQNRFSFSDPFNKKQAKQITFLKDQTSNGYIDSILFRLNVQKYETKQIRNSDFIQYSFKIELEGEIERQIKMAKCYGFRNIQKIVQLAKKNKCPYAYVQIMACPGGCFSGGGQIRYEGVKNKEIIAEFNEKIKQYPINRADILQQTPNLLKQIETSSKVKYKPIQKTLEQSVMNW